ncbi:beta-lactamase/transpeptidase-like protein [Schizothecium vesticola]|uniref:Beta-lactamase/transpeptidase-like protein n=1 Tax=Schizothecium vesticola TaxID=314040 RepID=A0AA40F664_9PEZI|nr:beta-lactamase/transpeptidase-like protein [Schizothecium vesticola]
MKTLYLALVAATRLSPSYAKAPCPLYGPIFPKPTKLLSDPAVQYAATLLDGIFPQYIDNANSSGSERFSYSVEVFSATEDLPLYAHHWTATNLPLLNSSGVTRVTGDSVYRIGSITKIFTILTFLATVGDGIMNDPVSKHLPEIAELAAQSSGSAIWAPDWDSITVGSLATQTSGLIRDYSILGELSYQLSLDGLYKLGFPPIPVDEFPPCGHSPGCTREQLFAGLGKLPPSFPPFATPTYSDLGFTLLGYIAERVSGKDFESLMKEKVLDPLNLKHTFYRKPDNALGIIPGNVNRTTWAGDLGEEAATGNMFTSSTDLSNLGRAILRSTLIKPAMTRRWMKPFSFTSDPKAMVGMPWGVRRLELVANQTYQNVHTYNKAGSIGSYFSLLALIPELDIGYTVLVAGDPPPGLTMDIAEALTATYFPTLVHVARAQANTTYGGTYTYTGTSLTSASSNITTPLPSNSTALHAKYPLTNTTLPTPLNSTLTLTVDSGPGLALTRWISNGTDMLYVSVALASNLSSEYWDTLRPNVRLYPTGLEDAVPANGTNKGGRKVAFKAVFEDVGGPTFNGTYKADCATWVGVTGAVYGSRPLDLFVFEVDAGGRVVAVENGALRVGMSKVG